MTNKFPEIYAAKILESVLGVEVVEHDDGSQPSMPDLIIRTPDGDRFVEVVSDVDAHELRMQSRIEKAVDHLAREPLPHSGTWSVCIAPDAEVHAVRDEYTFQITAAPTITTTDGGETILVTSSLTVVRAHDRGSGDDLSTSESFIFIPGERSQPMNEAYGTDPDVSCDAEQLAVGESTTCAIAFEAEPSEVQDSYWQINGFAVGTWPSQTHTG